MSILNVKKKIVISKWSALRNLQELKLIPSKRFNSKVKDIFYKI